MSQSPRDAGETIADVEAPDRTDDVEAKKDEEAHAGETVTDDVEASDATNKAKA